MANNYTDILTLVNAGNQMGLSNTIKRDYGIPLDFTSVQETYDAAVIYAATSTLAYVGQTVAVGGKLYIISDVANGTHIVGEGEDAKTYDNYLAEVGSKTEGDGNTIELNGQTLKLAGLTGLDNTKTYVPSLVNGKLVWAEPSATTVEGLDTRLQAVEGKVTAVESILNGTEEADGLVDKVADNTQAIADEAEARANADEDILAKIGDIGDNTTVATMIAAAEQAAKDYADANDADTIYDDTALSNRVTVVETAINDETTGLNKKVADNASAISAEVTRATEAEAQVLADAKAYTDAEIDGLSVAIEQKESVDYIVLKDKEGVEIASVNASKFVQDSFLDDVAYDSATGKITFTWSMGDGSTKTDEIDVSDLVDTYTAGNGLTLTDNQFAVDTTKIATVEALTAVSEVAEAAQTAQEVSDAIDAKITAANLGQYAKATDVETALAGKVDTATYEAGLGTKVSADAYATDKAALQTAIDGKVSKVSSEYEGAQVEWTLLSPENQAKLAALVIGEEGDIEVSGTVNAENVDGLGAWITTNRNAINGLLAEADKTKLDGIESGAEVNIIEAIKVNGAALTPDSDRAVNIAVPTEIASLTDGAALKATVASNTTLAQKGVADAKTANDAIVTINETLGTHSNDISAVKGRLATLETAKGDHETRIATVEGKVTTLETTTANNSKAIGELQGADAAHTAEDERLAGLIDTKANAADVYTKGEIDTTISGINTEIGKKANAADVYTKTEVNEALANLDQSELEANIQANTDAIAALVGEDTGKTVRAIAAEETAAIVAGADAKYDTLKEIADFIINDETGAAAMANDIAALKAIVDTGDKTVTAYVADQLAAIVQPKASTEISVATDGTLGINKMSVEKLEVPEGVEFILFGGDAQSSTAIE